MRLCVWNCAFSLWAWTTIDQLFRKNRWGIPNWGIRMAFIFIWNAINVTNRFDGSSTAGCFWMLWNYIRHSRHFQKSEIFNKSQEFMLILYLYAKLILFRCSTVDCLISWLFDNLWNEVTNFLLILNSPLKEKFVHILFIVSQCLSNMVQQWTICFKTNIIHHNRCS